MQTASSAHHVNVHPARESARPGLALDEELVAAHLGLNCCRQGNSLINRLRALYALL